MLLFVNVRKTYTTYLIPPSTFTALSIYLLLLILLLLLLIRYDDSNQLECASVKLGLNPHEARPDLFTAET